jgi:hypothetical protein
MLNALSPQAKIAVAIAIVVIVSAAGCSIKTAKSADELNREAYELRMEAMKKSCSTIGEKIEKCYNGNKGTCEALQESIAWFMGEYGEAPDFACTTDHPFVSGGKS